VQGPFKQGENLPIPPQWGPASSSWNWTARATRRRRPGPSKARASTSKCFGDRERRLGVVGKVVQEACRLVVPDGVGPSISIGIAECSAGDTLESLRQRADAALSEAKRNGKGRLAAKESPLIRELLNPR
jgi:hypothetical protein